MKLRRGGRGSNQYQTKPGGAADGDRTATAHAVEATAVDDYDSEDIAAMFDPSRRAWVQAGFPAEDIDAWEAHGFDIAGAVEASWAGLTPEGDGRRVRSPGDMWILRWTSAGFRGQELVDWLDEFSPEEAAAWRDRGLHRERSPDRGTARSVP